MNWSRHTVTKFLIYEKRTLQYIVKSSSASIIRLVNCTKLNWYSLKISTEKQSLVGFFFNRMLNKKSWSFTTISSKKFPRLTSMTNLKWTQTPSTWLCPKKIVRYYSPWKARRLECDAFGRLSRQFWCQRKRQFLSHNVLQNTQEIR